MFHLLPDEHPRCEELSAANEVIRPEILQQVVSMNAKLDNGADDRVLFLTRRELYASYSIEYTNFKCMQQTE